MWLEALEEGFSCFLGRDWERVSWGLVRGPIISSKAVPEDLNVKLNQSLIMALLIVAVYAVLF